MSSPDKKKAKRPPLEIGWREWIYLPELCDRPIKAKIDTGARTTALHATNVKILSDNRVSFYIHPDQDKSKPRFSIETDILEFRTVKSSTGHATRRPVIVTNLKIGERQFPIEVTLTNREDMGFRLLLGRSTLSGRIADGGKFVIHAGKSFLTGRPPR